MMISINLRPGAKRGRRAPSFSLGLGQLRSLGARFQDPLPALAMVAWVGAFGFLGWTFLQTSQRLAELEPRLAEARSEHQRFQDFLQQKQREEATRDSLVAQIQTIQQVDGDRYVWPHVLDEVARALPPLTWLVNVTSLAPTVVVDSTYEVKPAAEVQITGRTIDIQGYTRFMRQLEDSPWLENVTAVSASTVIEEGRALTAFVLKASFTPADSGYVRTVPVAESVGR